MTTELYGGLDEKEFRNMAKKAVKEWFNGYKVFPKDHPLIEEDDIFIVWQVKAIQNSKALLGISLEDDGLYFEATWNGDHQELYLDVYKKQDHVVLGL